MDREAFREALLAVMESKEHPSWPAFTSGRVPADRLHLHLEQEWGVYIRDFPVLLGRAYVQCPLPEVRRDLAENLYEEETGGLGAGRPHPELFLEIPAGLGMDLQRFHQVRLIPEAQAYRGQLDAATVQQGWPIAVAVTTLFLEGTPHERHLFDPSAPARPEPPLEDHPLVRHYKLPVERLALVRAHRDVEGGHRIAAWRMVLDHVPATDRAAVVAAMEATVVAWSAYRGAVASACGVQ